MVRVSTIGKAPIAGGLIYRLASCHTLVCIRMNTGPNHQKCWHDALLYSLMLPFATTLTLRTPITGRMDVRMSGLAILDSLASTPFQA